MQELDRLYFSKYLVDPENALNVSDELADEDYDDLEISGMSGVEDWSELD